MSNRHPALPRRSHGAYNPNRSAYSVPSYLTTKYPAEILHRAFASKKSLKRSLISGHYLKKMPSSFIQTILSAPEFHQICESKLIARGLYRRWGIAPRPEDIQVHCTQHRFTCQVRKTAFNVEYKWLNPKSKAFTVFRSAQFCALLSSKRIIYHARRTASSGGIRVSRLQSTSGKSHRHSSFEENHSINPCIIPRILIRYGKTWRIVKWMNLITPLY